MNRLLLFITLSILTSESFAASVFIDGGGESFWNFRDDVKTTNGLPAGGGCIQSDAGSGAAVCDAAVAGQEDAFDYAVMYWVNNIQVGGLLSTPDVSSAVYTPVNIDGLSVQLKYELISSSATLRAFLTLANPTDYDISASVVYANNYGSDTRTSVLETSSGDVVFDTSDRWVVTDDYPTTAADPSNTTVLYGPDSPAVTPSSVSQTVFSCSGTQGTKATYNLLVPAGETYALMMFQQLNTTVSKAMTAVSEFDSTPGLGSELLTGLSEDDLLSVVNWSFNSNEPPVAEAGGPYIAAVDLPIVLDGTASDPDGNILTFQWSTDAGYFEDASLEDPVYYAYNLPGIYDLSFKATDPAGLSDTALSTVVVYDPYGGFITGGGWVYSEAGSYAPDPSLEGRANFSFTSRYHKAASVPTGDTSFMLTVADLDFQSDKFDWLVVNLNDSSAHCMGSGTINGKGEYRFMLWGRDGSPDTFRIKIWKEEGNGGETVIYDNGIGQPIGGGNIVIHSGK
jgi:hypothetical protein